ncbi:MAG: ISAs1 family transposase [Candidatus Rhabdochlamydia sp.]
MAALAESMEDRLSKYVDVSSGTPSAYTLERVISLIEPTHLEKALHEIGELLREEVPDEVIAIDGKSLRGTRQISQRPLHLLHAWSCTNRVCLGQIQVDEKSNEKLQPSLKYSTGSILREVL